MGNHSDLFDIRKFDDYKEDNRREVKKASGGLPHSLWETYSSFANCYGGVIILGVIEHDNGSWETTGLKDTGKLLHDFWNTVNNLKKVSVNLLTDENVETYEVNGDTILVIHVPMAKRADKPVFINDNLFGGTYRRNWEGDYHCSREEVKAMLRDQTEDTYDMTVLDSAKLSDLNSETIRSYRNRHQILKSGHPFEGYTDEAYLDEQGAWQKKTEKEYLCMRNGEERGFTAAEFKAAQKDDWEKQYPYRVEREKKVYMTPSAAEAHGYERASKYPKSTKYGRQNPITAKWNSEGQLLHWRKEWADAVNRVLEQHAIDERIDHRSFAARGLAEQPTIHEGYIARSLEERGVASDRCEINRQIRADNRLLRQLREQASRLAEKVTESAAYSLSSIAESLENIRGGMIRLYYHLQVKEDTIGALSQRIDRMTPAVREYETAGSKLAALQKERDTLRKEKKATGLLSPLKGRRLQQQINLISEEIEEMRSQRTQLMHRLNFEDTKEMTSDAHRLKQYRDQLNALKEQKMDLTYQIGQETERFDKAKRSVPPEQELELIHQRLSLRKKLQDSLSRSLKAAFGSKFNTGTLYRSENRADVTLNENSSTLRSRAEVLQRQQERQLQQGDSLSRSSGRKGWSRQDELEL